MPTPHIPPVMMDKVKTRTQRLLPGSTPSDASELWPELAGRTILLLAAVSVAVTTRSAVGTLSASTRADGSGTRSTGSLLVGGGDNLGREMEPRTTLENSSIAYLSYSPLAEVLNTLGSQDVIVPLPGELSLDETAGGQALESLDDLKVRHIEFLVLGSVEVLLGDKDTLCQTNPVTIAPPVPLDIQTHP